MKCSSAPRPGTPTVLPLRSAGFSMPLPWRATRMSPVERIDRAAAITTISSPASLACSRVGMVGPATCTEPLTSAGGLLPELAVSTNSMSMPRFLKKPCFLRQIARS